MVPSYLSGDMEVQFGHLDCDLVRSTRIISRLMIRRLRRHFKPGMRATKYVVRDHVGFIEYPRIPTDSQWVYLRYSIKEEVLGTGTYQLKMWTALIFMTSFMLQDLMKLIIYICFD